MVTDTLTNKDRIPRVRTASDFFARLAVAQKVRDMGVDPSRIDLAATARHYATTRCVTLAQVPDTISTSGLLDEDLVLA